ncbi:MAG: hypothetical protein ABSE59_08610, partial [Opitutaceae bacterium]
WVFPGLPADPTSRLFFRLHHDEDVQVYLNGTLAFSAPGYTTSYGFYPIDRAALVGLVPGQKVEIAVHCHQTTGGQYIDVGIVELTPSHP